MIALSHGGTTTYRSSAASAELAVGTADGVVFLQRSGEAAWAVAHRALAGHHISSLISPEPGLIFAGVFQDAVHASADAGKTWKRGEGIEPANVYSLLAVKRGPNYRIYAGTQPAHLFYSDDLGMSWTELSGLRAVPGVPRWNFPAPPHEAHVKHLVADHHDAQTMYACIEQGGLLKSVDAGVSWRELSGVDEDVHFLSIDPRDAQRLYISSGVGCYATSDGGRAWSRITTRDDPIGAYPDTLVRQPGNPDRMFLGAARVGPGEWRKTHRADARVCQSRDGGRTWAILDGFPRDIPASIEAMALEDCGESVSLFAGTTAGDVWASGNGGASWKVIAAGLAPISKYGHERALQGM